MPPNPPIASAALRRFDIATCKFPNLKKIIIGPPLPNPGYATTYRIKSDIDFYNSKGDGVHPGHLGPRPPPPLTVTTPLSDPPISIRLQK